MSEIQNYPLRGFNPAQKFLIYDPANGTTSLVLGSSLVDYITPGLSYVFSETTRAAAAAKDYSVGRLIQTAGGDTIGDGGNGLYLVVAEGEGDYPMLNGNELMLLPFGTLAGSDIDGALVTVDAAPEPIEDVIARIDDDIEQRAVRFANLEAFRASSFGGPEAIIEAANAGTTTGRMILKATGTTGGTPTVTGSRFSALASGEIINEGGYGFALSPEVVWTPEIFGAPGNNTDDNLTAINLMFSSAPNYKEISFVGGVTYRTTGPVVIPDTKIGLVVRGNGATIRADHNGDGLVITSLNENYSRHKIYDLNVQGPNVAFPNNSGELAGTSTGSGLVVGKNNTANSNSGYLAAFYNCSFTQFHKGVYLQACILLNFVGGYIAFNQYGVYVDGGATNANTFTGVGIRQNRIGGVYSSGRTGGTLTNSTHNVFDSCTIETNIPYDASAGGYPATYDAVNGWGVYIANTYDWVFQNCYFENHNRSIVIESSSDDNRFNGCRFDGNATRPGYVVIAGAGGCNNNVWFNCKMVDFVGHAAGTFHNLNASNLHNQLIDCIGFSFNPTYVLAYPHIRNLRKAQGSAGNGQNFGAIAMSPIGYYNNPGEGTAQGTITGIGTTTATLNAFGVGEFQLGSNITAATEITTIAGGRPGQLMAIVNYQAGHAVTLKSAVAGTGAIVLKSLGDAVMNNFGQMILLYCVGVAGGRWYEVGRNF